MSVDVRVNTISKLSSAKTLMERLRGSYTKLVFML